MDPTIAVDAGAAASGSAVYQKLISYRIEKRVAEELDLIHQSGRIDNELERVNHEQ